ncbi:hypothetical protein SAMN05428987_4721 [Paenibacillus sp. CF095]|nr:hypothetical protein SAMN05428987_4721 [Paenibacillus sp. CF095]
MRSKGKTFKGIPQRSWYLPVLVFGQTYETYANSLDLKDMVLPGQGCFFVVKSGNSIRRSQELESISLWTASARHCIPRSISSGEAYAYESRM